MPFFRIRNHGDSAEVLQAFIESARHKNKNVRSEAAQLAVALVRLNRKYSREPRTLSNQDAEKMRRAMAEGLTPFHKYECAHGPCRQSTGCGRRGRYYASPPSVHGSPSNGFACSSSRRR